MENRPIGPEEQDDTTDSKASKKKRGSTLSRYLSALRGKEAPVDDSEDASSEKPKRAQRLFSRLFPGIVERPAHLSPQESSEQEHAFDHEAWFGWVRSTKQAESATAPFEQTEHTSMPDLGRVSRQAGVNSEQAEEVDQVDQARVEPEELAETLLSDSNSIVPNPVSVEQATAPRTYERPDYQVAEAALQQQGEIPLRASTEAETIIERRGSNVLPVVLVGAEYLARKRADRKLESRVEKKIDATTEKQQRAEALQKELEHVVSQNKQQIEQLKRARTSMEQQGPRASERKETPPATVPAATETLRPPQPETVRIEQKPSAEEVVKPYNIAERVADAAEHDVPVERAFERSHEVKDDIPMTTAAASVGAVMAANIATAGITPVMHGKSTLAPADSGNLPYVSDADIAAAYRQAAKRGFWSAICLIVLGSIAYVMVKYT